MSWRFSYFTAGFENDKSLNKRKEVENVGDIYHLTATIRVGGDLRVIKLRRIPESVVVLILEMLCNKYPNQEISIANDI